jgi:hypothetical protein
MAREAAATRTATTRTARFVAFFDTMAVVAGRVVASRVTARFAAFAASPLDTG